MTNCYFITGATGALGSALVPLVLEDPNNEVRLLIRAETSEELNIRLKLLYDFWGFQEDDCRKSRTVGLIGDATSMNFGLTQDEYDFLSSKCTHIIHCAGAVRMNLSIEEARRSAVGAAEQIIKLARLCLSLKKVDFVSTVGVKGKSTEPLQESWITKSREFHNTYEQAKAEAENLVQSAVESGLPMTVHRPSMVVGDSVTGKILHYQVFYHVCEFLSGRRTCGIFPILKNGYLDIIPADYVAKAVYWSSINPKTAGRIFHLCSGENQLSLLYLQDVVAKEFSLYGINLPYFKVYLSPVFFRVFSSIFAIIAPPKIQRAIRTLPILMEYLASEQIFSNKESNAVLSAANIYLPKADYYLSRVLLNYLANKYKPL